MDKRPPNGRVGTNLLILRMAEEGVELWEAEHGILRLERRNIALEQKGVEKWKRSYLGINMLG